MPNKKLRCEKDRASSQNVRPVKAAHLTDDDVKEIYKFVNKVADNISEGDLTYKDNLIRVEIKKNNVTLECTDKKQSCTGQQKLSMGPDREFSFCPKLGLIYEYVKQIIERKQPGPRPIKGRKKVDKYLYKLQPNQAGRNYWYIQFTENGRSKQVYLGKNEPTFNPKKDLQAAQEARRQREQKKMGLEVALANN